MFLTTLFLFLSLGISSFVFCYYHLYTQWYCYLLLILSIPLLYLILFAIYLILLFIASLFINKKKEVKKPNKFINFFVKETCFQLLLLSNTKVHFSSSKEFDPKKKYMVISNHISNFDPIALIVKLGIDPLMCITKKENISIPICGAFIHKAGFISLDRNNFHSSVKSISKAIEYIQKDESSVYVCPEGTRSKSLELLPFHAGTFKIALNSKSDIVVCYIQNTNLIHKNFPFKRTHVYVKVLDVIPYEQIKDLSSQQVANLMFGIIKKEEMERKK